MKYGDLPDILTAADIAKFLKISRRRVYELFQAKQEFGGIPNFEVGLTKRVDKEDFATWINDKKKQKAM